MKKIVVAALLATAALAGCHHKQADTTPANGSGSSMGSGSMGGAGYGAGSGSAMTPAPAGGM